jgi:CHAD domain-containing protein
MASKPPDRRSVLRPLADRLLKELGKVVRRPENVDAVHDARVAARRVLAAREIWGPESDWNPLRKRLVRLVRRLGRVRNTDVTLGLLSKGRPADAAARRALGAWLRRRRKRERQRLSRWLTRTRVRKIRRRLDGMVRARSERTPAARDLAIHFTRIVSLAVLSPWSEQEAAAHEVRREVRMLRYGHETLQWAYEPAAFDRARRRLLEVQDRAGSWRDRCVLERFAARAIREGGLSASLDPLLSRVSREAKTLAGRFVVSVSSLMELRPTIAQEGSP